MLAPSNLIIGGWTLPSDNINATMAEIHASGPPQILHVVGAAIVDEGRCLAAQRGPTMPPAGRWEFPGGKVEEGETAAKALVREIEEELGLVIGVGPWLGHGTAAAGPQEMIALDVFVCRVLSGIPEPREHQALRWITGEEIASLDWALADVPVLPALKRILQTSVATSNRRDDAIGLSTEEGN